MATLERAQGVIEAACEKIAQGIAAAPSYELTEELNLLDREHEGSVGMALDVRIDGLRAFLREQDG